jgi:carbon-monoxide dehydrogenase medium subunit
MPVKVRRSAANLLPVNPRQRCRREESSDAYLRMIRTEMISPLSAASARSSWRLPPRVGLGAVAPTVLQSGRRQGACWQQARRRGARYNACSACRPIDDKRGTIVYRTKVAGVLLKRTVAIAAKRAREN